MLMDLIFQHQNQYIEKHKELKLIQHIVLGKKYFWRVPQGSILGSLLFNIFLCGLFFLMNKKTSQVMRMLQVIVLKILLIHLKIIQ